MNGLFIPFGAQQAIHAIPFWANCMYNIGRQIMPNWLQLHLLQSGMRKEGLGLKCQNLQTLLRLLKHSRKKCNGTHGEKVWIHTKIHNLDKHLYLFHLSFEKMICPLKNLCMLPSMMNRYTLPFYLDRKSISTTVWCMIAYNHWHWMVLHGHGSTSIKGLGMVEPLGKHSWLIMKRTLCVLDQKKKANKW